MIYEPLQFPHIELSHFHQSEAINKESVNLLIDGQFRMGGDILDVLMIANIICNTEQMEYFGPKDVAQLRQLMRKWAIWSIQPGARIEVINSKDDVYLQLFK